MARFQLNAASGGINRQRVKGGPKPDNLYDILNGYVDASGAVLSRPGTQLAYSLPAGTIGVCAFDGKLVVFSREPKTGLPPGVVCEVLTHPDDEGRDPGQSPVELKQIHYAGPFLGYLYVTAEFEDGGVYDYWLESAETWAANTHYGPGQSVQPLTPNGYTYRANRMGTPGPVWAAGVERKVGDVVEPTVANGYEYVCIEAIGSPPRSGQAEPKWPTQDGEVVIEEADVTLAPPTQQQPPSTPVPPRYSNPGGSTPGGGGGGNWERGDMPNQVIQ